MRVVPVIALTLIDAVACAGSGAIAGAPARPTPNARSIATAPVTPARPSLVGVWRVIAFCSVDSAGRETYPYGQHPTGVFVYAPTGQLSLHAMRTPPGPPFAAGDSAPTEAEGRALLRGYFGYFGTYTVTSDSTVTHHVEGGTIPSYIGTDQHRHYRIRQGAAGQPDTLSIGGAPVRTCRKLVRVGFEKSSTDAHSPS